MIVVRRHHRLGLQEAKRLAESIAERLRNDYGGSYAWKGNELHFERPGASGSVAVAKDDFEISIELSLLLSPLRSVIEREIRAFCDEHFGTDAPPGRGSNSRTTTGPRDGSRLSRSGPSVG